MAPAPRQLLARLGGALSGHGGVLLLFLILGWVVAFGSGAGLTSHSFGGDLQSADAPTFVFYFWHFKQAVLGQADLYYTDRLFYPVGMEMIRQNWAPVVGLLALPFAPLGPLAAYNLQYWLAYVLSGFFAYLLAADLLRAGSRSRDAAPDPGRVRAYALLAGLAFAFCEFRLLKAHHFGLPPMAHQEFIPLYLLGLLRFSRGGGARYALLAGVSFFLATFTSPYQMVFLLLLSLLVYLWQQVRGSLALGVPDPGPAAGRAAVLRRWGALALLGGGPALLLAAPILLANWQAFLAGTGSLGPISSQPTDLLAYLTPHAPRSSALLEETRGVFFGYALLAAVLLPALLLPRGRRRGSGAGFWLVCGGVFFVFSLGAALQVGGQRLFDLPFFPLLGEIPLIRGARTPARFASITLLCLALGAALLLYRLEASRPALARRGRWLRAAALLLVGGELCTLRFANTWQSPGGGFPAPPVNRAYRLLAQRPDDATLLVTPLVWEAATRRIGPHFYPREFFYLQTIHHKRLITGMGDAVPASTMDYFDTLPFVSDLSRLERGTFLPPPDESDRAEALALSRFLGLRYLLVNRRNLGGAPGPSAAPALLSHLEALLPLRRLWEDEAMVLLELPETAAGDGGQVRRRITFAAPASRVHLGVGWQRVQRDGGWLAEADLSDGSPGALYLRLPGGRGPARLTLEARCPGSPCRATVRLNGRTVGPLRFGADWTQRTLELPAHLRRGGINRLRLDVAPPPRQQTYPVGRTGARSAELVQVASSPDWASVGIGRLEVTPETKVAPEAIARDLLHSRQRGKKAVPRTVIDGKPGYTVVAIDPASGDVVGGDSFDLGQPGEAARMVAVLSGIPRGTLVGVTLRSRRPLPLPPELRAALGELGADLPPEATPGPVFALLGVKGAPAGSALQATDPHEAVVALGRSVVRLRSIAVAPGGPPGEPKRGAIVPPDLHPSGSEQQ